MTETKYIEETSYPANLTAGEKTIERARLSYIPVALSEGEMQEETRQEEIAGLLEKAVRSNAENPRLIDLLAAYQGFTLPRSKNAREM